MNVEIKKTKDLIDFLEAHNYIYSRASGSHRIYINPNGKHISIPFKTNGKDLCFPMVKRLIKEVLSNEED